MSPGLFLFSFFPKVYYNKPKYDLFKFINTSIVSKAEKLESDLELVKVLHTIRNYERDSYYMWISCDDEKSRENHIRAKQKVESGRALCTRRVDILGTPSLVHTVSVDSQR